MAIERVKSFIDNNHLIPTTDPIIVGFSGGPDSVALLTILHQLQYTCIAAHCNFHLRGEESDRDMRFAQAKADELGINIEIVHFDTNQYASDNHLSIEMAARDLRYNWFRELKKKYNAKQIAIAHHSDDVVETFFINLLRGTGMHGLTGIKPINGDVVRPLLCLNRADILNYLNENGIDYIIDSSNKSNDYLRNKIRNVIVPELEKASLNAKNSILKTISNLKDAECLLYDEIDRIKNSVVSENEDVVEFDLLKLPPKNTSFILFELLRPFNGTKETVNSILASSQKLSGQIFYTATHKIYKNRDKLLVTILKDNDLIDITIPMFDQSYTLEEPIKMLFEVYQADVCTIVKSKNECYIDIDKVKFPLHIRKWKEGDYFYPFGQNYRKKVSDYFINEKMSLLDKEKCLLLATDDDKIVWIVGKRADNRFRITDNSKKILRIII